MEKRKAYCAPSIETLSTVAILEALGPVSAYGGRPEDVDCDTFSQTGCSRA